MSRLGLAIVLQLNINPHNNSYLSIELSFTVFTLVTPCSSSRTLVRICSTLSMPQKIKISKNISIQGVVNIFVTEKIKFRQWQMKLARTRLLMDNYF